MTKRNRNAFTLVELLLAISIIVLVAGMIVPMVGAFSSGGAVEQTINEIKSYLLLARQQAVQQGRPVAVFFLPPTSLTPNSRMILVELRDTMGQPNNLVHISNWRVVPAEYGASLRQGIEIRKRGDGGAIPEAFCVAFTAEGFVDSRCPPENTAIRIGPRMGTESAVRATAVAINRSTGSILQLKRTQ